MDSSFTLGSVSFLASETGLRVKPPASLSCKMQEIQTGGREERLRGHQVPMNQKEKMKKQRMTDVRY